MAAPTRVLPAHGIPSPRQSTWAVSAIYGSPQKGTGVLNNELYRGIYIWNRSQWVKNPDTGKRTRIERPESEWKQASRPELQIVPDELWQTVKSRQNRPQLRGGTRQKGKTPRHLLSGILRCGKCGGPMTAINAHSYGCSIRINRGTCDFKHTVTMKIAESRILDTVRNDMLSPEAINLLKKEVRRLLRAQPDETQQVEKRRKALKKEIDNLTQAIPPWACLTP